MKKIFFVVAASSIFLACNNSISADKATTSDKQAAATAEGTAYTVDTTSAITWTGTKPGGSHTGIFSVKDGSISFKDSVITGGNFTINILSLNNSDLKGESKGKLEGHLKSADFFDAEKFPTAKFEITGIEPFKYDSLTNKNVVLKNATHTIKGNFTLKDSTKNISFPAIVAVSGDKVTATADFNIDRTLWGLNYKGPNNPQDWAISKQVNIKLNIAAAKK
ncbi:MAG: YceI family protein [Bacteroidota bacterium]